MAKKKTQEEFENELRLIFPDIKVIGKYINTNTKIKCKCLIHNFEFESYPVNLLHGHGCSKCGHEKHAKTRSKSQEQFFKEVAEINPDVEIVGEYINAKTKVKVRCKIDGYEWDADPRKLLRGVKCGVCANRIIKAGINDVATTRADLVEYFKNKEEATKYAAGSDKVVNVICPICGYEDKIRIGNLSRFGFSCNGCHEIKYGRKRVPYGYWNEETMAEYIHENYPGYKLLDIDKVVDNSGIQCLKAFIKCPDENHEPYWAYWTNIISGYECYQCSQEKITSSLQEKTQNYILFNYKYQLKHERDCSALPKNPKTGYVLPYDNEVIISNNIRLIIEVHGEQHYKITGLTILGAKRSGITPQEELNYIQWKDEYKKQYALDNGYFYLALPYWEFDNDNYKTLIDNKIQEILNNTKLIPSA